MSRYGTRFGPKRTYVVVSSMDEFMLFANERGLTEYSTVHGGPVFWKLFGSDEVFIVIDLSIVQAFNLLTGTGEDVIILTGGMMVASQELLDQARQLRLRYEAGMMTAPEY